jgi:hypothetical protein
LKAFSTTSEPGVAAGAGDFVAAGDAAGFDGVLAGLGDGVGVAVAALRGRTFVVDEFVF